MYRELAVNLQIRPGQRLKRYRPEKLILASAINVSGLVSSIDFMLDRLSDVRAFRTRNLIDDYNRGTMGLEVDFSMLTPRVTR
jgi:putative transposase